MSKKDEALKLALEALEDYVEEYGPHEKDSGAAYAITAIREALAEQQQEPVAVPATPYEHRKFVLVGREWYERFAAFHDDCQIGAVLTREEQTVRQQGYENGWNDAQRYLRELQQAAPAQQQEPVAIRWRWPGYDWNYRGFDEKATWANDVEKEPLYTSPPASKPWVGLTDEDLAGCDDEELKQARYWENKLKEKNAL